MTSLAYRNRVLAVDSASTINGTWTGAVRKIARAKDGSIGGGAGPTVAAAAFLRWIDEGASGEPNVQCSSFSGLLIRPSGSVWIVESGGPLTQIDAPFHAAGSGREILTGAMAAGASAKRAVEIACEYDGASRGPVQVLRLGKC